jgi:hypothetical protein
MSLFLFITLYIFRAHSAHHQERQIVPIQPLVTVILCWWPRCVQVASRWSVTKNHYMMHGQENVKCWSSLLCFKKCFNNSTFLTLCALGGQLKCFISLMHGVTMKTTLHMFPFEVLQRTYHDLSYFPPSYSHYH